MRAKRIAVAAAGGTIGIIAIPLAALASTAPVGSAAGTALTAGSSSSPIASISSTSAQAGSTGSGSSADVLSLGGNTLIGGSSSNGKTASGSLAGTGSAAPADVEVAPWSARSTAPSGASSSSEGQSAVANATAGAVSGRVASSDSKADYTTSPDGTTTKSSGCTTTDGLVVNGPGIALDVLHADACSNGQGNAFLASLNGNQIGTQAQIQAICKNLNVPSVLALNCVAASGGAGSLFEEVLGGVLGPNDSGIPVTLFGANGVGGGAGVTPGVVTASAGSGNSAVSGVLTPAPSGPGTAGAPGGNLPFTGAPIALWLLTSVALMGIGAVTIKTSSLVVPRLYR
jgi:hypothetical protein